MYKGGHKKIYQWWSMCVHKRSWSFWSPKRPLNSSARVRCLKIYNNGAPWEKMGCMVELAEESLLQPISTETSLQTSWPKSFEAMRPRLNILDTTINYSTFGEELPRVLIKITLLLLSNTKADPRWFGDVSHIGTMVKTDGEMNAASNKKILEENLLSSDQRLRTGHT